MHIQFGVWIGEVTVSCREALLQASSTVVINVLIYSDINECLNNPPNLLIVVVSSWQR